MEVRHLEVEFFAFLAPLAESLIAVAIIIRVGPNLAFSTVVAVSPRVYPVLVDFLGRLAALASVVFVANYLVASRLHDLGLGLKQSLVLWLLFRTAALFACIFTSVQTVTESGLWQVDHG